MNPPPGDFAHVGETEPTEPAPPSLEELSEIPWEGDAVEMAWRDDTLAYREESDAAAEAGKYLLERELAELENLHVSFDVGVILSNLIPTRAARRNRAIALLGTIRRRGLTAEVRHGAVRINPACPADLAGSVHDLDPELAELLDDGE